MKKRYHFSSCLLRFLVLILVPLRYCIGGPGLNDDVLGLIVFKADIIDPGSKLSSWNEDDDSPCNWKGVNCDSKTGRVTELSLDGFGLSGRLGRGLLQLQSLQQLTLSNNNFTGSFSAEFSRLGSIISIDLSSNSLSGSLPDEFFRQCGSIRSLSLAKNVFSGEIPPSVGSCSSLASLNLSSNRLFGNLPSGIWSLTALRLLDLSDNLLAGDIPPGIGRLYNLRMISLSGNKLSGNLRGDIGDCLLLKSIDLSRNSLSGSLPEKMWKLSFCSSLNLSSNLFSGSVPEWIGGLKNLQSLDLSNNGFSGGLPDSIGSMWQLRELRISGNHLNWSLPETISNCKSLVDLDFSRNFFMGSLPSWVFESGIQKISISENQLSGQIWVPAAASRMVQVLDLSGNAFSGVIPVEIGNVTSLKFLNLSRNFLSGTIPASIGRLKSVQVIDFSSNRLTGNIPSEINGAISLQEMKLDNNSLTGKIPVQIGNCSSLTSLILSRNNLTGPIPSTLSNLTNLQAVDLSFNRLSGGIPKQLGDLANLHHFNISHNHLSGDVPAGNFFNKIPPSSLSDNPDLCGSVVNSTCNSALAKPIVLNPNSSSPSDPSLNTGFSPENLRHKKIILSISALIAIGAAALISLGVVTITILNVRVRAASASQSAAALTLSDGYMSNSPATDSNSGKLVMFSGDDPDFSAGTQAILSKDCELGRGGFGAVYKTVLRDGRPVAIKKLTVSSLVKSQEDFEREVKKLGKMRHPNLITLEGYYWTSSLQLLIYEFVSGGSLYKHLHEMSSLTPLSWQERFDIIMGIAKSLAHLHRHNIIHYNLKSSNVLIDGSGEPKVGDYGLAKLLPMLDRYVLSSKIQSALGYMAPEFACRTVKITDKCDVFGFGVLVLEIVTGRRPVEYMEDDVVMLCDVVRGALADGRVEEFVDGKLQGGFPIDEAVPVVKLGLICTSQIPSNRPDMGEVVNILELIKCPQESQEEESS